MIILSKYLEFMLKGFSAFIVGSLDIDGEKLYNVFLKIAILNFIVIAPFPFVSFLDSMNYMRFGYAMVPSVIMFFYAILEKRKFIFYWITIGIISFLLMVIFGNRGTFVVLFLWVLLQYVYNKISLFKKTIIIMLIILLFSFLKLNLLIKAIDYVYYVIGIRTYALIKLRMMIEEGFIESSSGRDKLYITMWQYIKQNPFFGYGIGFSERILGSTPHNVFIQVLIESGFVGLLFWLIILIYCSYKLKDIYIKGERRLFNIITLVFSIALGRLLVSSDMWLRPEYWLVLSMLINYKNTLEK